VTSQQRPSLRTLAEDLERTAARYGELQTRLDRTTATASSPDGAVRVTVDAGGAPTSFAVTERFRALDPRAMEAVLLATVRQAQVRLRDQVTELTAATVGDDAAAQDMLARYRERFPDPPPGENPTVEVMRFDNEDTPPPPPPPSKKDGRGNRGDDDFGGSVYR
jgi:DNA-binding protein YbaB